MTKVDHSEHAIYDRAINRHITELIVLLSATNHSATPPWSRVLSRGCCTQLVTTVVSSATSNCASDVTHYSSYARQVVPIIFTQSRVLRVALLATTCSHEEVLVKCIYR